MSALRRLLAWFRVTDDDGRFSLTHAALVFACVCIWRRIPISLADFGTFALALGAYQAKKYVAAKAAPLQAQVANDPSPRLDAMEKAVATVADELKAIRNGQAWAGVLRR